MRKHGTLVIGLGAGSVEKVAALTRFLLQHLLDNDSAIDIHSHLNELCPVINLYFIRAFFVLQVNMG